MKAESTLNTCYTIIIKKKFLIIPLILISFKCIINIFEIRAIEIGALRENMFLQCTEGLFPLIDYLVTLFIMGLLLNIELSKKNIIRLSEIGNYMLGILAIQIIISIYAFNILGMNGIWISYLLFYIFSVFILTFKIPKGREVIMVSVTVPDIIILFLSIGIFAFYYYPYGIYNIYGDQAIILSSALSIARRENLTPYYLSSGYYSSIGGFLVVNFVYITGVNNILLASTLPFLIGLILIPFVTYHFINNIIKNDKLAMLGTIMSTVMDGLATLILPLYVNNLNWNTIYFEISRRTFSLASTNILYYWFCPYKVFSIACITAALNMLFNKDKENLIISGALLTLSLTNPRQSFVSLLGLLLLLLLQKLNLKEIIIIALVIITSLGQELTAIIFMFLDRFSHFLMKFGIIDMATRLWIASYTRENIHKYPILTLFINLIAIIILILIFKKSDYNICNNTLPLNNNKYDWWIILKVNKYAIKMHVDNFIALILYLLIFLYSIIYFYQILPFAIISNPYFRVLNYLLLRYHACIPGLVFSIFLFKESLCIIFLQYLGLLVGLRAPLIMASISVLGLQYLIKKHYCRATKLFLLIFIFLGIFSGTFFASTVRSNLSDPSYNDTPYVLSKLLTIDPSEKIYSPSFNKYYVYRLASFAQIELSNNPDSRYWLIDKVFTNKEYIALSKKFKILYHGNRFILLRK